MRVYTVHRRDRGPFRETEVVFVKEGFSWPAFLFAFLWAFWHRMWIVGLLLLVADLALSVAGEALDWSRETTLIAGFAFHLLIGLSADELRRWSLRRAGYGDEGVVAADTLAAAEWRFFDAHPEIARP